jgi:hypothetical protein
MDLKIAIIDYILEIQWLMSFFMFSLLNLTVTLAELFLDEAYTIFFRWKYLF